MLSNTLNVLLLRPQSTLSRGLQVAALFCTALFLLYGFRFYSNDSTVFTFERFHFSGSNKNTTSPSSHDTNGTIPISPAAIPSPTEKLGDPAMLAEAPKYIKSIMDSGDTSVDRLECPRIEKGRYEYLKSHHKIGSKSAPRFYFALDLYNNADLLPRLMGSIVESMKFLGPEKCTLSIVEGHSTDGTYEILKVLRKSIEKLGATYHFVSSDIDPKKDNRIDKLAQLRNLALAPLLDSKRPLSETTVIFLNDVAACPDDILELIHQLIWQDAHMTCAMDWKYLSQEPTFYDVWVARDINGDSFFRIPENGSWDYASNLFPNNTATRSRFEEQKPFQVFACWNGGVAFTAEVLAKVKFRAAKENECYSGEPTLFNKDMWVEGFGKIAVVPSINLGYSDKAGRRLKAARGYVSDLVMEEGEDHLIEWQEDPPSKMRCIWGWHNQYWVDWNEAV